MSPLHHTGNGVVAGRSLPHEELLLATAAVARRVKVQLVARERP